MSNVVESMETELFSQARPKGGGSSPQAFPKKDDSFGHAKRGWSLIWVCQGRMWSFHQIGPREEGHSRKDVVIPQGMPRKDMGISLGVPKKGWSFLWTS